MGMPDGYQVDVPALTAAAGASTRIAGDALPALDQVGTALGHISGGAPGSRTASVADAAAGQWPDALKSQVGQVRAVGEKLESTARDYLGRDTTAAETLNQIAAGSTTGSAAGRIGALLSGEDDA